VNGELAARHALPNEMIEGVTERAPLSNPEDIAEWLSRVCAEPYVDHNAWSILIN
jgi:hypothetical protein